MEWQIRPDRPVYLQLVEQLELAVLTGEYPPGSRVPAVRELAAQAAVNPNTMQRALAQLEAQGLLETHRTAGRTVCADEAALAALRRRRAAEYARAYLAAAARLGMPAQQAVALVRREAESAAAGCAGPEGPGPEKEE